MYILVVCVFTLIAAWFIFKIARKKWHDVEADEVKCRVEETEDVYKSVKDVNTKKFKKQHDKVEKIKEATDL